MPDDNLMKIAGLVVATAAIVVALLKEDIQACWRAPVLKLRVSLASPDSHKTSYSGTNAPVYYVRGWVTNEGKTRAEDIQVAVANLLRQGSSGTWEAVPGFMPMNLKWSHGNGKSILERLPARGMGRHVDIAHIVQDPSTLSQGHGPAAALMELDLEVVPNTGGHRIVPRFHLMELKVAAGNADPVSKWFQIDFVGTWYDEEADMFSKGLRIHESGPPSVV